MRVLLDTNVLLDVLLKRHPWVTDSATVWQAHDKGHLTGYIVASVLTDIFYIARRFTDLQTAHQAVRVCLQAFEICPVDRQALVRAEALSGNDFEDNLQIACADLAGLDAIVTRDNSDFKSAPMAVLTPTGILKKLS